MSIATGILENELTDHKNDLEWAIKNNDEEIKQDRLESIAEITEAIKILNEDSSDKSGLAIDSVNQRYFAVGYVGTMPNGHYTGLLDITTNGHYLSRALTIKNINELHPIMHGIVLTNITEMTKDDFDSWTNDG